MTLLFTHALLIPADGINDHVDDAWVFVRNGLIDGIGQGTPPPEFQRADEVIDLAGKILAPGFVSSHSHLFTSASRGLGANESLYGWCTAMYSVVRDASPEDIYWCVLHGALDYLSNGVTCAFDFADSLVPWQPIEEGRRTGSVIGARPVEYSMRQVDAKVDAGIRFIHAIHLDDQLGSESDVTQRFEVIVDHVRSKDRLHALDAAVMGSVQWSDSPQTAERERAEMDRHGIRNQAHFLETIESIDLQRSKFAWYDDAGVLGPDFLFGHFVHPTDAMISRVAETGTAVSWQATANGRLGSGVARVPEFLAAGIGVGLGLDDQACTDIADPWQNMRMGLYTQRAVHQSPTALTTSQVLHAATLGAATILGVEDQVGSIEVGKLADLLVVNPGSPDLGPVWHPLETYVLACSPRNLERVYVGGELTQQSGRSLNPLAAQVSAEVHARLRRIN